MSKPRRVLLKISGESLKCETALVNQTTLRQYVKLISEAFNQGIEVGVVVGGGNILRGASSTEANFSRVTADQIGMLATVMNALFLRDALTVPSTVLSAITIEGVAKHFNPVDAKEAYSRKVVIFAGGIGNPLFSTDTSAALRAIETECDCVIKLTDVGGVYTADPKRVKDATLIPVLTFEEVLQKRYSVMDLAAFCLCQEHNMPIIVTKLSAITTISDLLDGKIKGTTITP